MGFHPMEYDKEKLKSILIEHTIPGQEIKLIASRDGLHLTSHGLREEEEDTFSAMCATMFGAGETAFYATDRDSIRYAMILSKNSKLYLFGAGEQMLVAVMVAAGTPEKSVLSIMEKMAGDVVKLGIE